MKPVRSLTLRLVLSAGVWIAVAVVAGGALLSVLFRNSVERGFDARLSVLLESLIAATEVNKGGNLTVIRPLVEPRFRQPYSGWYWQITPPAGDPLRSRSLWDEELPVDLSISAQDERRYAARGPERQKLRVVERDITLPGVPGRYRFSLAGESREIAREVAAFNRALVWSLGALGAGLLAALVIQVQYGLRPLRRIRIALSRVRSGEARRLDGSFPSEIEPLVDELNALLTHNEQVVERARTHVGNLAHALKTPLAVLANEARSVNEGQAANEGRADETGLAQVVARQVAAMRRHVDHYLTRARTAAAGGVIGARTSVAGAAGDLKRTLERIHAERDLDIRLQAAPALFFRGEHQDFDEMLGNLMDNACKWAARKVQVSCTRRDGRLVIHVDDDGPGISQEEIDEVFGRGRRIDEAVPGSGLGLSIVRDIAELYGGSVHLSRAPLGGLRATLILPAAES